MSLLLKVIKSSERKSAERREKRCLREALRRREDPTIYQVKQKLRNHLDLCYSTMSEEDLTREAILLTDPEALKQFFSEITQGTIKKKGLREKSGEIGQNGTHDPTTLGGIHPDLADMNNSREDKVGELTLKLHLRRSDDTPSVLTRFGTAILKIPYGVLHAYLEIGDSRNPEVTYIVEFNRSSLVQPRRTERNEHSALEATVHVRGSSLAEGRRVSPTSRTPARNQAPQDGSGQSVMHDLSHICQDRPMLTKPGQHGEIPCAANPVDIGGSSYVKDLSLPPMPRPRSMCMRSRMAPVVRKRALHRDLDMTNHDACTASKRHDVIKNDPTDSPKQETTRIERQASTDDGNCIRNNASLHTTAGHSPPPQASRNSQNGEHLREDELALSKTLFINKLVSIIVNYNKHYYYHTFSRNCQTFVVDVLQSLGAWENFTSGDKLEQYLNNLTKGRQEVYKSHKAVNDRVKYLVASGEMNEITYDEARYLRSLYAIYHLDEAPQTSKASRVVCNDRECLFKDLEKHLNDIRPVGAMVLKSPEHYM